MLPHDLIVHTNRRHGVFTRSEARDLGISAKRIRGLIGAGAVEPVGTRVLRIAGTPPTPRQRVLTACLDLGAVATTTTASSLHGLTDFRLEPIEILVRDRRRATESPFARVHRTTYLPSDHLVEVDGIPTLNVARTLFSLAATVAEITEREVVEAIDDARRKGLATEPWLRWMLKTLRRQGRNGVAVFERALDRSFGVPITESWLETESLRIIGGAGLILPQTQARIVADDEFVARVDFRYPGSADVLEVNGHGSHSTRLQLANDAARRRRLTALGIDVYDFTYDQVVDEPHTLVETARAMIERARLLRPAS